MEEIQSKIPQQDLLNIIEIQNAYEAEGYSLFLVGGAIRDALMGKTIKDFDLATDAPLGVTAKIFKKVIPTGEEFGTLTVLFGGGEYEITRFRQDLDTDGRRATVIAFAKTLEEDLSRRDLTINGMGYNVKTGQLIDLFDGVSDIKNKRLRFIGDMEARIREDHLRSIRFLRFLHRYPDFFASKITLDKLSLVTNLDIISMERIFQEFEKMLSYNIPIKDEVINGLLSIGLFKKLGLKENDLNDTLLKKVFEFNDVMPLAIQHYLENGRDEKEVWKNLKLEKKRFKNIFLAFKEIEKYTNNKVFQLKAVMQHLDDKDTIRALYGTLGLKFDEDKFEEYLSLPLKNSDLNINGNQIMEMGFQGPEISKVLSKLLKKVWENPELNTLENLSIILKDSGSKTAASKKEIKN